MKLRLLTAALGSLFLASVLADAQVLEVATVRHLGRQAGNRVSETDGMLDIDAAGRALRFRSPDVPSWTVPLDAIRALHVEQDKQHSLVVHFVDRQGEPRFETFRLEAGDISRVASLLEHQTGIAVDRSGGRQSFLGIPIRIAIGDRVEIRDRAGAKVSGKVLSISPTSLTLASPQGPPRVLGPDSVARVRFVRSRGQNAARGLWRAGLFGAAFCAGVVVAGNEASGGGGGDGLFEAAGVCGLMLGGIGAALGAALPPALSDGARDVYIERPAAQKRNQVLLVPGLTPERRALMVSVRF